MILIITFGLSFGIICGLYWLLVVRPESGARQALWTRLRPGRVQQPHSAPGLIKETKRMSSVPVVEAALARAGRATSGMQELLNSADLNITVGKFLIGSALLGAVVYLVLSVAFRLPGLALLLGGVAVVLPYFWLRRKQTVRLRAFEEQFPDAVDLIARAMRAGHGLTAGLGMVGDEIPAPVGREFKLLYEWQNFGMSLPDALQKFAGRIPLLDARFFVTAVLTQRESGGNLSEILDNLSRVIRERFRVKRQIRVLSAHGRMTGMVLGGLPPALAAYFMVVKPDYLSSMLADPLGVRMIVGAVVLQVLGALTIRKLVDIEY